MFCARWEAHEIAPEALGIVDAGFTVQEAGLPMISFPEYGANPAGAGDVSGTKINWNHHLSVVNGVPP